MADNLIFPIGFDLEKGVKDVISRSDTYLRQIEHAMNRKPIVLRAEVDASKFQMFSRQFTNSIDGISAKLAQAQRLWNAMTFDVKFDADGNLSRRAQVVFDAFQQLTQASATMGQRLGEVNRNLAKSEQDAARAITAEYDKRRQQVNEQIRLKERQAAAEERVRQGQLKGVNAGYVETQRQVEAVRNLRLQYEAILPMLNAMAQRRYDIKVGIDKQFEADIQRINAEIARLRQSNLQLGAKGDTNAIQANLQAIRQLESELQRISQQKIDLLNSNKINSDLARLRTEISSVFGELQSAERRLAADNSLNAALDAQSQKVLKLHADIQKLDQQFAQLNATGRAYNQDGSFTAQANTLLQQRIALTKQLEQESITGQQAQIKLEQQLREEKRQTEQAAKNAAKEAERQAKAEAAARKQAQDTANAENKARQEAYNARRRQGQETQRILNKEAKSIADITAKLQIQQQRLQSANIGSAKFNKIAEEVKRLTADLEKANQKMRELTGQTQSGAARQSAAVKQVTNEFKHQDGYVSRLIKRLAVYASFSYASQFLTSIREVTAQFELQRVSLGAIIQDQNRANQLFSEIKQFALKSPVSILDLTKYTKQVAAYRIENDKLFDTTKRLADVSVGLGVDMGRIVLAYGQVKAASYLRAAEIRQFTEAGIPMLELLAEKFTKLNGEMVTTEQVMDMVSKRGVDFKMVEEIFNDMTSAGGMFYNMQEKQGNTLYGMWAKLGDAASVMYEQIGNTESINKGMKEGIQALTDLMRNWQSVGRRIAMAGIAFAAIRVQMKLSSVSATEAGVKAAQYRMELNRLQMQYNQTAWAANRLTIQQKLSTLGMIGAARFTSLFSTSVLALGSTFRKLGAIIASTGWGALAVAIGYVIEKLFFAKSTADKLKESLEKVYEETSVEQNKSARNFEYLASLATDATKGYKERKDALDELQRTYKNILPQEVLELEYLTKLKGNYDSLTNSIREYVAEQQRRKAIDTISEEYGSTKLKYERKLTDYFRDEGWSEQEIARFWEQFYKSAADKSKTLERVVAEAAKKGGHDGLETAMKLLKNQGNLTKDLDKKSYNATGLTVFGNVDYIDLLRDAVLEENKALEQNEERTQAAASAASKFTEANAKLAEKLANMKLVKSYGDKGEVDRDSYLGSQMLKNENIKGLGDILKEEFEKADLEWEQGFGNFINRVNAAKPELISSLDFTAIIESIKEKLKDPTLSDAQREMLSDLLTTAREAQQEYMKLAPSDVVVQTANNRLNQIVRAAKGTMDDYVKYQMKSGQSLKDFRKDLKENIDALKDEVKEYLYALEQVLAGEAIYAGQFGYGMTKEQIEAKTKELQERQKNLEALYKDLPSFDKDKKSKSGGTKSDDRLSKLQEILSTLEKINQKYDELKKKEGDTKALADVQKIYKSALANANKILGSKAFAKFGLKLEMPTDYKDLQRYRKSILDIINALRMKGYEKAAQDLETVIGTGDVDQLQKKIEKQLKELADRISRTKTANEFYDKVLGMTGDIQLAANLTVSVYGQNGQDLQDAIREQIRTAFETDPEKNVTIDLSEAIDPDTGAINYNKLAELEEKYKDVLIDGRADLRKKLIDEGRKTSEAQVRQWLKDIEKAKDFAQQRIDLATYTANQIAAINAREDLPQAEKDKLIKGYQNREAKQLAKLQYDEFKDSAMYVHIFEDLDHASTTALKNMRDRLVALKGQWKNLDPTQVKELTKAIADLDEQIAGRSPFKSILDGFKGLADARPQKVIDAEMIAATDELAKREEALAAATKKLTEAQTAQVNAQAEVAQARQNLEDALAVSGGEETAEVKAAREVLGIKIATFNAVKAASKDSISAAKEEVDKAADKYEEQKKVIDKLVKEGKLREANIKKIELANQKIDEYQSQVNEALDGVRKIMESFGASAEDMQFFDDVTNGFNEIFDAGQQGAEAYASFMMGDFVGAATKGIGAVGSLISGVSNLFYAGRVKRANKEIKRQQELLEQLQYTYSRLEYAADKAFGSDYVNNYNQQLKNLQAQQQAYLKQAEAERSKGKKKDKEKIKEYEEQARETADKIKELQDDLVAHFTGSSKTDIARQMAKSWIDARASMSDTFAAIKGDYADMVKNMIVEGAAARVIENALTPVWDSMQKMLDKNDVQGAIDSLVNGMDAALSQANNGMEVLWKALEARGYDMKNLIGDTDSEYTGIAKSVAGATSEEINNVAAIGNTLMYYVSPIPRIDENLARVVALMEGKTSALPTASGVTTGTIDYTEMFTTANQHLSSLPRMEQHLAEIHTMLGRALKTKGSTTGFNTFLNS